MVFAANIPELQQILPKQCIIQIENVQNNESRTLCRKFTIHFLKLWHNFIKITSHGHRKWNKTTS